jgi:multidrug efflux pump subunit AcrB
MVTARFRVGADMGRSTDAIHAKLASAADRLPPGTPPPLVQPHGIDDVPALVLSLTATRTDPRTLRTIALRLQERIRTVHDVAQVTVAGGARRAVRVTLDPARLAASGLTAGDVAAMLPRADARAQGGEAVHADAAARVDIVAALDDADAVGAIVVGAPRGVPVRLGEVARIVDGTEEAASYVAHGEGRGAAAPAVVIAVAKRAGANATTVTRAVRGLVDGARATILPSDVTVHVVRDHGLTAKGKADTLIEHLLLATASVTLLVWWALGWREALVVLVAVPVTLALTLFAYYALGYTLNRITLFALIFSIGILVDDAIVVVENIYRHLARGDAAPDVAAVRAVDEVGNPTILATVTVIAAILPMAFVSGLMGPYMRPIPVGATVAMLASLGVAFVVTPWAAYLLLARRAPAARAQTHAPTAVADAVGRRYRRLMAPLLAHRAARRAVYATMVLLLGGAALLVPLRAVQVKMLPFDDKSEFQVVLDFPEGTTLEASHAATTAVAARLRADPDVRSTDAYVGTAGPVTFSGLVRHWFLRRGPTMSDIAVTLAPPESRTRRSHDVATGLRPAVDSIARRWGAAAKVAEIPPGPPVLSTLVAEVYAADDSTRLAAARAVRAIMARTPGVVDVDWSVDAPQRRYALRIDRARAGEAGADPVMLAQVGALALDGAPLATLALEQAREAVPVIVRLAPADRADVASLLALPVPTRLGPQPLGRFVTVDSGVRAPSIAHRNQRTLITVTADVAGAVEAPVYAILDMNRRIDALRIAGASISRYDAVQPASPDELAIKWDGEWHVTLEVFRDLGLAFAAVLVLIYVLVVAWFRSFSVPLVIMAPIPLTLVGILPAHAAFGAYFTATSMIGMIALAGIIVRNSILLVDFIQLELAAGRALDDAVLTAGAVRFRPIALTAAAVVVGGAVMVLDPIFQGLAVSLIGGAVVATALTMVVVPLLLLELAQRRPASVGAAHAPPAPAPRPPAAAAPVPLTPDREPVHVP